MKNHLKLRRSIETTSAANCSILSGSEGLKVAATTESSMSSRGGVLRPLIQTGSGGQPKRAKKRSFQGTSDRNLGIRPREASRKKSRQK